MNCDIQKEIVATGAIDEHRSGMFVTGNNVRIEGCCISLAAKNTWALWGICIDRDASPNYVIDIVNCTVKVTPKISIGYSGGLNATIVAQQSGTVNIANTILLPLPVGVKGYAGIAVGVATCNLYINNTLSTMDFSSNGSDNVQLTQEAFYMLNTDFSPRSNSPAVNAGDNSFVTTNTDLLGNPRIRGGKVDTGAIESAY